VGSITWPAQGSPRPRTDRKPKDGAANRAGAVARRGRGGVEYHAVAGGEETIKLRVDSDDSWPSFPDGRSRDVKQCFEPGSNAIQFIPEGGRVRVAAGAKDGKRASRGVTRDRESRRKTRKDLSEFSAGGSDAGKPKARLRARARQSRRRDARGQDLA